MIYEDYREIPLKIFLKVLRNEENLKVLIPGLSKDKWAEFKEKFEGDNPTPELDYKIEKQQEVMVPSAKLQLYRTAAQFALVAPESWERIFDISGIKKKKTLLETLEYIDGLVSKEQVRFNIAQAEFKKMLKEMPDEDDAEGDIFDVISSLSAVTGNRLDYGTSTIGELLAEQRLAQKIAEKQKDNG